MKKELSYITLNYTKKDLEYIEYISDYVDKNSKDIVSFFNIESNEKVSVTLFDSLEKFRIKFHEYTAVVPEWACGFSNYSNEIFTLCLSEYNKTKGHEKEKILDLANLILHEFTHSCVNKINKNLYAWLYEGIATVVSHQYDHKELKFNATLDEMISGCSNYINYHTMCTYVLDTYGKTYILELLNNTNKLINDTPRLYDEVVSMYGNKYDHML